MIRMPTYIQNGKAHFNYEVLDEYEAGIELLGFEVKAIRNKKGQIDGGHILIRGGEAYLLGMDLPPYQAKNTPVDYVSTRTRKLLLSKKELATLGGLEKGLTIAPLSLYSKGTKIKVKIAVVRGKKKFDKRETIKKRDTDREIRRSLKS